MTSILGAATLPGGGTGWQGEARADANKLFIATFDIGPRAIHPFNILSPHDFHMLVEIIMGRHGLSIVGYNL